ncbi:hypothetical protein FQN54_000861 [Arachnomyces sp. PD_36]|nr:hypothetical protein FQN54_000861 [Arachnomyces sp. PD_36]
MAILADTEGPPQELTGNGLTSKFYEVVQRFESEETSEIRSVYDNCKRLAKAIKLQEVVKQPLRTDIHDLVPSREVADQLVEAYLRTFESVFRVLHIPSFLREYNDSWNNPKSSSHEFVVKLLLVMAIGMVFLPERSKLRKCGSCPDQWIYTAQTWLSSPFEKNRINIPGIQIHCLLLLARLANGVGGDLIWISAGSLLRTAMHVGLHVDPSRLDKMSIFDCIMRRRLWATVLEIVVQSSVDAGGLPLVSMEDIDCELPSNVDDEQLEGENLTEAPQPKPEGHYTRSSIQIALMKSLPVRLEIARYMNDFRSELSYDKTLHLASRLSSFCRANFELFQESESQTVHCSAFQVKFLDLLTYRFLLALHHPFAIRSKTDPTYYFSRKTSLEVSLSLLSHSFAHDSQLKDDDFTHVSLTGTGMFRDTPIQSACMICDELIYQIEEGKSSFIPKSVSFPRGDLRQIVEKCIRYLDLRIKNGETNIRGHVFFSCLVGQIDAMHAGTSVQEAISEALRGSLDNCYQILRTRADEIGLGSPSEGDMVATAGSMQEDIAGAEGVQDWWFMDEMADGSFLQDFI